jgi:hypothetical protein
MADHMIIRTRAEAKSAGLKRFFTGIPCNHGHVCERWVSTKGCLECLSNRNASPSGRAWYRAHYRTPAQIAKRQTDDHKAKRRKLESGRWPLRKGPARERLLRNKYGLTVDQLDQMRLQQNNCCKICSVQFPSDRWHKSSMHVDHCHSTGKVRGLLCRECNQGIGKFRDSPDLLRLAILYLEG